MSTTPKPHIQEHFQQIIWYSLDNNLINNALFVAERLLSLNDRDQNSRHLLGLCFLRAGRHASAYHVTNSYKHLGCSYVFAQCCKEMGKYREGIVALENCLSQLPSKWSACKCFHLRLFVALILVVDDHGRAKRNHLPDLGAVLCLMGHVQRASGDSTRAMEAYVEALKVNPYLWEAFDGLVELGVSLKVENCFKASSTMRALRESTHATNIDASSTQPQGAGFNFSLGDIPEGSSSTPGAFQPIFNWAKSGQSAFLSSNQPVTPG